MKKIEEGIFEVEISDIKDVFKQRDSEVNKGDFGYVGIMGGCLEYSGAMKLANMSCSTLRSGAGVVRLIVPKALAEIVAPYLLEQTIFTIDDENAKMKFDELQIKEALNKIKALAIGMGWNRSKEYEKILENILLNYDIPVVIDADGLNTLAKMDLKILNKTNCKIILTPHMKEFERLTNIKIEEIKRKNIEIAKEFAKEHNIILLLKGHTTIVTDGKEVYLVKKGCPGMATAGSGDVLSGILVGLLGYNNPNLLTVATGAYLNGMAGEIAEENNTDIGMIASDTVSYIPEAIKRIRK